MLSVIIPTYNRARFIGGALDSLKIQKYDKKFEVVIIDDGSTDDTEQLIKNYSEHLDIRYFKTGHQGVSAVRNVGIEKAQGDVLVFFDDDAVAEDNWLASIEEIMQTEDIITGKVDPLNNNIWQYFAPHYNQGDEPIESPVLLEGNCAIKKFVFEKIGSFDQNLDYGHEGEEFLERAKEKYKIMYYPNVIIYHDYAFGLINYLDKQRKFGDKMVYLKMDKIKSLMDLILNYRKIKSGDSGSSHFKTAKPTGMQKIKVKLVARLGEWFHLAGAIAGYLKYSKDRNSKDKR